MMAMNVPRWAGMALGLMVAAVLASPAGAAEFTVKPLDRPDYKAVFGKVESRDLVPARARLGGTILSLSVEEGSAVKAGDVVAVVVDDKLALQLGALDARLKALDAELSNANADLERAQKLLETGVVPRKHAGHRRRPDARFHRLAADAAVPVGVAGARPRRAGHAAARGGATDFRADGGHPCAAPTV
jgi:multidrug efflux pump subunit AcrA (membrane-fusion protein)